MKYLRGSDVFPSVFFHAVAFDRRKATNGIDTPNRIQAIVSRYGADVEASSLFVHACNFHPCVKSRIISDKN